MDPHSHPDIPDDPLKFDGAIRAFRARVPMTKDDWNDLDEAEREYSFTVAGAAQADLVTDLYEAVARAIEDGTDLDDFKAQIGDALEESWGGEEPASLENIFRTNVMTAYNAGRYEAATAPAVKAERPFWRLDVISDGNTSDYCEPLAEPPVILPADHPWWQSNYPPRHFQCRDHVTTLTREQAEEEGIMSSPPHVPAMPGFGAAPSAGGTDWVPDPSDYPTPIGRELEQESEED